MSERWPGGLISPTAPTPANSYNTTKANGVWTLDQAAYLQSQNLWPNPNNDPYFYDVSLLLNGDGTNGAQNNTFLDSSTNNFTITRNGNTTQGSFSPYGNLWSNYFNNASPPNYLSTPTSSATSIVGSISSSSTLTIECWVYLTSYQSAASAISSMFADVSTAGNYWWDFGPIYNGNLTFHTYNGSSTNCTSVGTVPLNQWTHLAVSISSGSIKLFINGVLQSTTGSTTVVAPSSTTGYLSVGTTWSGGSTYAFNGYISNLRVVNGTALYSATFTPSTTPLTAITNTTLLTCQSNRFKDNSSNAFAITANGSPSVQRFSPFNPTAPYSTTTIGGSGYFDGTNSYLTLNSLGLPTSTSSFTIEFWYYAPVSYTAGSMMFFDSSTSSAAQIWVNAGNSPPVLRFGQSGVGAILDYNLSNLIPYQWTHFAYTRSGNTFTLYVNGTSVKTATNSVSFSAPATTYIGQNSGGGQYLNGYLSDFRVNNTVVYSGNFTPPTAPETAVSGTQLLLSYQNAGIPDLAMQNDLQTVGSAQVSTSVKKYGTGSLSFNGSTDYLLSPSSPVNGLGIGNFTLEAWIYPTGFPIGGGESVIDAWIFSIGGNCWLRIGDNGSNQPVLEFYDGVANQSTKSTTVLSANTWYFVTAVRNGTSLVIYLNGTSTATNTNSSNFGSSNYLVVGNQIGYARYFQGYIDDARITKGYARYTANFTPPGPLPTY